ncbi:MAG: hypothetical protein AB7E55_19805 [Pigmentiphaga sp.]
MLIRYAGPSAAVLLLGPKAETLRVARGGVLEVPEEFGETLVRQEIWTEVDATAVDTTSGDDLDLILALSADQKEALRAAGFGDLDALEAAGDEDLLAVQTIGKAALRTIRAALGQDPESDD